MNHENGIVLRSGGGPCSCAADSGTGWSCGRGHVAVAAIAVPAKICQVILGCVLLKSIFLFALAYSSFASFFINQEPSLSGKSDYVPGAMALCVRHPICHLLIRIVVLCVCCRGHYTHHALTELMHTAEAGRPMGLKLGRNDSWGGSLDSCAWRCRARGNTRLEPTPPPSGSSNKRPQLPSWGRFF
jgi:hypothetical protein